MPDICMCRGNDCPLKEKCYRYKAIRSKYFQTYFTLIPYKDGKCPHFWDLKYEEYEK